MKLCAVSESLGNLPFKEAAKASADLGLEALEIGMGNWSAAPHANLQSLLESKGKRQEFLSVLEQNGLSLAALNCSGNQLHPVDGERQSKVVFDTVRVAELLGVHAIVLMSGLPAGGPNDVRPNWVTCAWPPENREILDWPHFRCCRYRYRSKSGAVSGTMFERPARFSRSERFQNTL
jgi:sugar phosphate isomerase/epimerase